MKTIDRIFANGLIMPEHVVAEHETWTKFDQELQTEIMLYGEEEARRRLLRKRKEIEKDAREAERQYSEAMVELLDLVAFKPYLVIDNIANFMYRQNKPIMMEDLPCVALPRPGMWLEWPSPSGKERRGVLVNEIGVDHTDAEGCVADARKNYPGIDLRWVIAMKILVERDGEVVGPIAQLALALDQRGRVSGNEYKMLNNKPLDPMHLFSMAIVPLQAIAFMHCRNVKLDMVDPPAKLSRRHRMKHGQGLVRYQTVRLDVPRRSGGGTAGINGDTPLHIVDGHFAYYGDNHHDGCPPDHEPHGLLFGKFDGVYWMPSHVRGNRQAGEVITESRELQVRNGPSV